MPHIHVETYKTNAILLFYQPSLGLLLQLQYFCEFLRSAPGAALKDVIRLFISEIKEKKKTQWLTLGFEILI